MTSNIKTNFVWRPLIKIENVPAATFIQGADAQSFFVEYQGRVKKDYGNAFSLRVLSYDKDTKTVCGSNLFVVVLVNKMISAQRMRTATPADLERVLVTGALHLQDKYADSGIVIRSEDGANDYLAKNVMAQVRAAIPKARFPIMIPLSDLDLINDRRSCYRLGFELRNGAQIIYAPVLNKDGNFSSSQIDAETGLPKKIDSGGRELFIRNDGLSGLHLYNGLNMHSSDNNLDGSKKNGRIVLIRSEAGGRK